MEPSGYRIEHPLCGTSPRVLRIVSIEKILPRRSWVVEYIFQPFMPWHFGPLGYLESSASGLKQEPAGTNAPVQHQVAFQLAARPSSILDVSPPEQEPQGWGRGTIIC